LFNTKQRFKEIRAARSVTQGTRRITDRELLREGPVPFTPEIAGGRGAKLALATLNAFCSAYWKIAQRQLVERRVGSSAPTLCQEHLAEASTVALCAKRNPR
jgi:hypothetical protein